MASFEPLANSLRPQKAQDFVGQEHLLSVGMPLYQALHHSKLHSMILWGPPGTGKTTLARLLASNSNASFHLLSAVSSGVKDIKQLIELAKTYQQNGKQTIVFIDEIHRFTKSQQDYLLPNIENGLFTLIGATTENPSFTINSALLSRTKVYVLKALQKNNLNTLIERAIQYGKNSSITISEKARAMLIQSADGDGRRLLNTFELALQLSTNNSKHTTIEIEQIQAAIGSSWRQFDNKGEQFYDQISAMHKAMRGSDPDATIYWLCRMLDGGCDPRYLARRIIRMASEDIGNADPRALQLALAAAEGYERLGSPEGEILLVQAALYLASTVKSNAVYTAMNSANAHIKKNPSYPVPLRFRNAVTSLMKQLDYGKDYQYAHNHPDKYIAGEHYFPDEMKAEQFYQPEVGLEKRIRERLIQLKSIAKTTGKNANPDTGNKNEQN